MRLRSSIPLRWPIHKQIQRIDGFAFSLGAALLCCGQTLNGSAAMSLWDKIRSQLIDIIEWTGDTDETMVYRFERYGNEIKHGAQLTVREGQAAVFVNEGQIADVFKPGRYRLETQNLPILATLKGWKYGFESPFKAEVYFVKTTRFVDLKWGTANPIMLRDKEFGPVRLRAFGNYAIRVEDPGKFIKELVGTDGHYVTDDVKHQLRNMIVTRFTDHVGESEIPVLDLAANYNELSQFIHDKIDPEFDEYGIQITKFLIENISLPAAVEEALDRRTSMGVIGDLNAYQQYQAANAMEAAANNPAGGGAAEGMGLGMGFAMANRFAGGAGGAFGSQPQAAAAPAAAAPPPPPSMPRFWVAQDGKTTGPFGESDFAALIGDGRLSGDTYVCKVGDQSWVHAKDTELKMLFGPPPPPAPGG